jgi:hypothetical protein
MADLLERGAAWLGGMLQRHAARPVVYRRGSESLALSATIGQTTFELEDGVGGIEKFVSRDFLVPTAALVLGGSPTDPQAGDQIEETQGIVTFVHEVMAPGQKPCWRYSDPYRNTLRIHSKLVEKR